MAPAKVWNKYRTSTKRLQGPDLKYGTRTRIQYGAGPKYGKSTEKVRNGARAQPKVWKKYRKSTKLHNGAGPKYGTSTDKVRNGIRAPAQSMEQVPTKYETTPVRGPKV